MEIWTTNCLSVFLLQELEENATMRVGQLRFALQDYDALMEYVLNLSKILLLYDSILLYDL